MDDYISKSVKREELEDTPMKYSGEPARRHPLPAQDEKMTALEATELQGMKTLSHDISDAFTETVELDRRTARSGPTPPSKGAKTIARITKIDDILKGRGPTTLKELETFLNIRHQEMKRTIARLDRSRYEILFKDGDERQTVLKLKPLSYHILDRRTARSGKTPPPKVAKTLARITKVEEILKSRGPTTLKELELLLNIRPPVMWQIITRLDRSQYEILFKDGDKRQKVLRLKVQIR